MPLMSKVRRSRLSNRSPIRKDSRSSGRKNLSHGETGLSGSRDPPHRANKGQDGCPSTWTAGNGS